MHWPHVIGHFQKRMTQGRDILKNLGHTGHGLVKALLKLCECAPKLPLHPGAQLSFGQCGGRRLCPLNTFINNA